MTQVTDDTANILGSRIFLAVFVGGMLLMALLAFGARPFIESMLTGAAEVEFEDRFFFDLSSGDTVATELPVSNPADVPMHGYLTVDPAGEYNDQLGTLSVELVNENGDQITVAHTPADRIDLGEFTPNDTKTVRAVLQDFDGNGEFTVMIPVLLEFS